MAARTSGAMPGPVSSTSIRTTGPRSRVRTVTQRRADSPMCLRALLTRLSTMLLRAPGLHRAPRGMAPGSPASSIWARAAAGAARGGEGDGARVAGELDLGPGGLGAQVGEDVVDHRGDVGVGVGLGAG